MPIYWDHETHDPSNGILPSTMSVNGSGKFYSTDCAKLAAESGIILPPEHEAEWTEMLQGLNEAAHTVMALDDYKPSVDWKMYPRTDIHVPVDTVRGGWALKMNLRCIAPKSRELEGRTVAIKDNIGVAGVPCTNGSAAMPGWVPDFDATIITRILDAGGVITGKSACENGCYESTSETAVSGIVDNPWAEGYSAGGSSSGSASLVAAGAVDMSIGCDQGGSIRMPASFCGIVGLKPTWGLVPYTGIIGLDASIDHTGPMTANVQDCALLLEAIAGSDGLDDRQQGAHIHGAIKYADTLSQFLETRESRHLLEGISIGILVEGFGLGCSDPNVDRSVMAAARKFEDLGATVRKYSLPSHSTGQMIWGLSTFAGSYRQAGLGHMQGRKQVYMTERIRRSKVTQEEFDFAGAGAQSMILSGLFLERYYGPSLYARCKNLTRKLSDDYDKALSEFDVLITPTTPFAAPRHATSNSPVQRLSSAKGLTFNTSPFDATGHPAISIPIGFVPAVDDPSIKLPVGIQIIGPKFGELLLLKVAGSWEKTNEWKKNIHD